MKVISVDIKNFMAIGEAKIHLADKGLVLVQGENRDDSSADSNGASKSTMFNALFWCWTGDTPMGVSGDSVINRTAGKGTAVSCVTEEQGSGGTVRHTINRYRKGGPKKGNSLSIDVEELVDGKVVNSYAIEGTSKRLQEMVYKILGCGKDVLTAAVYAAQERMVDLPAMTDSQLKAIIENAADIDTYTRAYGIAKSTNLEAQKELATAEEDLAKLALKLESAKSRLVREMQLDSTFLSEKDAKLSAMGAKKKALEQEIDELSLELSGLTYDPDELKELSKKIEDSAQAMESARDAMRDYDKSLLNENSALEKLQQDRQSLKMAIESYIDNILTIEIEPSDVCGKCGAEYDNEKDKQERIKGINGKIDSSKLVIEELTKEIAAKKDLIASMEAKKPETVSAGDVSSYMNRVTEIQDVRSEAISVDSKISYHTQLLQNVNSEFQKILEETNPYTQTTEESAKTVSKIEGYFGDLESKRNELQTHAQNAERVKEIYSPKGVRAHVLDQVTPYLNERTSDYLNALTDGNIVVEWNTQSIKADGELAEKFNIELVSDGAALVYKALSGGEKRKVRLACSMALQDLVASRATKSIDLYIADEIDDALDKSGRERLMGVMQEKAVNSGTVIVISHNDLTDWISETSTVIKEGGYARIEGALSHG